jgi:AraC-like DNA-binding protein
MKSVEVVLDPSHSAPSPGHGDHWHYHRAVELTLISAGMGTRFVGDHIGLFEARDLVLIGSNVPHYWHARAESAGMALQWDFPLDHGIWRLGESSALTSLHEAARRGISLSGRTAETVARLMAQTAEAAGLQRLGLFLELSGVLAEAPERDRRYLSRQAFSLSAPAEKQEAIRRAVSYILANHAEPVRLEDLLKVTGMSRPTFARQFKEHAGKSFSSFLNQVRIQAVCRALQETNLQITEIALSHGFRQLSFFNRLFRREIGCPPSRYRAQFGEERARN